MSKEATARQLAALVLPATLPGVVRPFTPLRPPPKSKWGDVWIRGCALESFWDEEDIGGRPAPPELFGDIAYLRKAKHVAMLPEAVDSVHLRHWLVDLTDATGRVHVAWAIGAAFGSKTAVWGRTNTGWALMLDDGCRHLFCAQIPPLSTDCHLINDIRIPDGSRWVDAEALRLVALHVLGD